MITSIVLENFKCFRKLEVNPRLVTVFIGPNGTGKSSVLQALALLKQSADRGVLDFSGALVNLGEQQQARPSFQPTIQEMRLGLAGFHQVPLSDSEGMGQDIEFSYDFSLDRHGQSAHRGSFSFEFEGSTHTLVFGRGTDDSESELSLPGVGIRLVQANMIGHTAREIAIIENKNSALTDVIKRHVVEAPARVLETLRLVPAARGLVRRSYRLGDSIVDEISFANGLSAQEEQTATNLAYLRELENQLSHWLQTVTGVGIRARVTSIRSVAVEALDPLGSVNIVAEGFGTNALVFLFVQLASTAHGATVMIEEPEIHLHPRAQADLASVLAEVAKAEEKQLIMTTHSEHILGRLLTLVAEKQLSHDELAVYAFEKDDEGVCAANELEITEDGRVIGGIRDFFEPTLDEVERYMNALQPEA